jgi:RNA polymerase sigma-70 factor (ECF subfamily)
MRHRRPDPATQKTDAEIIAASVDDPEAFFELFERHFAPVHRFVGRQLGPPGAEDASAEVFLRALRGVQGFSSDQPDALPWLLGIATNVVRRELRRRYGERRESLDSIEGVGDPVQERRLDAVGRLAEVEEVLSRMPLDEREPLLMYAWLDVSYEQIALALEIPTGTVRSRIARGRRRLREELGLKEPEVV